MKKSALMFMMVAGISLSACNEAKNPLEVRDSKELAEWIYKKKTPVLEQCGAIWADQSSASKAALENCETTAEGLAIRMTEAGFGNVKAAHVKLPTIWMAFNDRIQASKANSYDAKKAAEAMRLFSDEELQKRKEAEEAEKQRIQEKFTPRN